MSHPYRGRSSFTYWKTAVASVDVGMHDPVTEVPFRITRNDEVATAGSCFAQHIARSLRDQNYKYMITESASNALPEDGENYGVFTARYGNIYTTRQLVQLFDRAYYLVRPRETVWRGSDAKYVDPFRPQIAAKGWTNADDMHASRERHLSCVRDMFEGCDVFIYTLGLTECWIGLEDGMAYPIAPGVILRDCDDSRYQFVNLRVSQMVSDILLFIDKLRTVNKNVKIIITVSPVPLIATAENQHVLLSNTYSKSALRVVADEASINRKDVAYFPSYEIIAGPQSRSRYYAADLRSVTDEGVANVMSIFSKHFLSDINLPSADSIDVSTSAADAKEAPKYEDHYTQISQIICDEELIVRDNQN